MARRGAPRSAAAMAAAALRAPPLRGGSAASALYFRSAGTRPSLDRASLDRATVVNPSDGRSALGLSCPRALEPGGDHLAEHLVPEQVVVELHGVPLPLAVMPGV